MYYKVLREFDGLSEFERPTYMNNHGTKLIANTLTFPEIPNTGPVIKAAALTLYGLLSLKNDGPVAEKAYQDHLAICKTKMENNYNDVDLVADGNAGTIALAGLKASSDNTARVGVPSNFVDLKYTMTNFGDKIKIEWGFDDLSYGTLTMTSTDMTATLEQSGPAQLKLTVGTSVFFIDVTTKSSVIVEHLTGGSLVRSRAVKFNTNGMNPMVTMNAVVVPMTT